LTGDPDLYVSTSNQRPDDSDYEWIARNFGSDHITIENPEATTFYIGVYGWESSTFSLVATLDRIQLLPGQPHDGYLEPNTANSYSLYVPPAENDDGYTLLVTLQFYYGQAGMYAAASELEGLGQGNYTWASTEVSTVDLRNTLTIDTNAATGCTGCTYFLSVFSETSTAYTITFSYGEETSILLSSGSPYSTYLDAGSIGYYYAFVDSDTTDVSIDVTMYLGDVQLYVCTEQSDIVQESPLLCMTDPTWSDVDGIRGMHISISTDDKDFILGAYYLTVFASVESRFSIVVSTNSVMLQDGSPVHGLIPSSGHNTYFFYNAEQSDFRLDISGVPGSTAPTSAYSIFVTNSVYSNSTSPDIDNYVFFKSPIYPGDHMVFLNSEPNFCDDCTYFITVQGIVGAEYDLRMTMTGSYAVILNEQYIYGSVSQGAYVYYETFVDVASNFTALLETCHGNADLYLSQSSYMPTSSSNTWNSALDNTNDRVDINDGSLQHSGFYIGVYGSSEANTDFRLTVHTVADTGFDDRFPIPGNNAMLVIAYTDANQVTVSFEAALRPDGSPVTKYTAYYYDDAYDTQQTAMYSLCGIEGTYASNGAVVFDVEEEGGGGGGGVYIVIDGSYDAIRADRTYKLNIVAEDDDGNQVPYQWTYFTPSAAGSGVGIATWEIALGIAVVVVLLVTLAYLIIRNRSLTKELDIEMQDVPKSVVRKALAGPRGGGKTKTYAQLLMDDDEDEDGDYIPPM